MFSQSGVLASSKSASHTFAPELSALMVIFRSVGPVISTRRSTRPGAGEATRHSGSSLMCRVAGRKSSVPPADSSCCRAARAASSSARLAPKSRWSMAIRFSASGVRISSNRSPGGPVISMPLPAAISRPFSAGMWN